MAEILLGELLSILSPTGNIRIINNDYATVFNGTVLKFLRQCVFDTPGKESVRAYRLYAVSVIHVRGSEFFIYIDNTNLEE